MTTTIILGALTVAVTILAIILETRYAALKKSSRAVEKERDELSKLCDGGKGRAETAEKKLAAVRGEREALQADQDKLRRDTEKALADTKRLTRENRKLRSSADEEGERDKAFKAEIADLREDLIEARRELASARVSLVEATAAPARPVAASDEVVTEASQETEAATETPSETPSETPAETPAQKIVEKIVEKIVVKTDDEAVARARAEAKDLRGKLAEQRRSSAAREAEFRKTRNAYETHLRAYRMIKAEVDLLEQEVTFLRYGEKGYVSPAEEKAAAEAKAAKRREKRARKGGNGNGEAEATALGTAVVKVETVEASPEVPAEAPKDVEPVVVEAPAEEPKVEEPVVAAAPAEERKTEEPVVVEAPAEERKVDEPVVAAAPVVAEEPKVEEPAAAEAAAEAIEGEGAEKTPA